MSIAIKTWGVRFAFAAAFVLLLGVPFLLRPPQGRLADPLDLIVLSPHDEAVKIEFARAFSDWHQARFGRPVKLDWRNVGGGQGAIDMYVQSQFDGARRQAWGGQPGPVPDTINWPAVDRAPTTAADREDASTVRVRAILANVGVGVDVLFGGGEYAHSKYKRNGWLVACEPPADYLANVPPTLHGVELYDGQHYWFGAVLTRLGILVNRVVCRKIGVPDSIMERLERGQIEWTDLADAGFRDQLALADPNLSGSAKLCYEVVLQKYGWARGWPLLTWIAANGRFFGAGSTQVALDVSRCEAAAGMIIDYYGRTQVDYLGHGRLAYCSPPGATATTPDPISIFRGAPNMDVARRFVQFVLGDAGQKLWMGKLDPAGRFGGPRRFELYRPPIRQDLYATFAEHMVFAENPYTDTTGFNLDSKLQGKRFRMLPFLMRAAFIDNAELLKRAADAARAAGRDSSAYREFEALPFDEPTMWRWAADYNDADKAKDTVRIEELNQKLYKLFREKYGRSGITARPSAATGRGPERDTSRLEAPS